MQNCKQFLSNWFQRNPNNYKLEKQWMFYLKVWTKSKAAATQFTDSLSKSFLYFCWLWPWEKNIIFFILTVCRNNFVNALAVLFGDCRTPERFHRSYPISPSVIFSMGLPLPSKWLYWWTDDASQQDKQQSFKLLKNTKRVLFQSGQIL